MIQRTAVCLSLITAMRLAVAPPAVCAAETSTTEHPDVRLDRPSLLFRRILVRDDHFHELLDRHRPMKKERFEQIVDKLRTDTGWPNAGRISIEMAEYSAKLESQQWLRGNARLDIQRRDDQPSLLVLRDCGLAIGSPTWAVNPPREAHVGLDADGRTVVLVDDTEPLRFDWSAAGKIGAGGDLEFLLQFPRSSASRLHLDVPAGLSVEAEPGIVSHGSLTDLPPQSGIRRSAAGSPIRNEGFGVQDGEPSDVPWNRWQLELGGRTNVQVRITSESSSRPRRPVVLYRRQATYDLSPAGAKLSAELRLNVENSPLRHIVLQLDPGLELTQARLGDRPLPWTIAEPPKNGKTRVVLEPPGPIQGSDQPLRLGAVAALKPGSWDLPRMVPEGMLWQEGHATLRVQWPLSLNRLETRGYRQTAIEPLPAPLRGEKLQLQCFDAEGSIRVQLEPESSELTMSLRTLASIGSAETVAQLTAEFAAKWGQQYQFDADVSGPWVINTVESDPPEMLDEWKVVSDASDQRLLRVRLRDPLRASRPLRLRIQARRLNASPDTQYGPLDFELVRFRGIRLEKRVLGLRGEPPYQLTVSGDAELTQAESSVARRDDVENFDESGYLVFIVDRWATGLRVSLSRGRAEYGADIGMDVALDAKTFVESYSIRCRPESRPIDRLTVNLSRRRPEPLSWTIVTEGGDPLPPNRSLDARRQPVEPGSVGETWDIVLLPPQDNPFSIRAHRAVPRTGRDPVSMAALPQINEQHGRLTIWSKDGSGIDVDGQGRLQPTPSEISSENQITTARVSYRYEPAREAAMADGAPITINESPWTQEIPAAWVWQCTSESKYGNSGVAMHSMCFKIQNSGVDHLQLRLPDQGRLHRVLVDGASVPLASSAERSGSLAIPLPNGVKFPTVLIELHSPAAKLRFVDSVRFERPEVGVPVLDSRWTIWLPSKFSLWAADHGTLLGDIPESGWRPRIFGPFAGARRPFDLFSSEDWKTLLWQSTGGNGENRGARDWVAELGERFAQLESSAESGAAPVTWIELLRSPSDQAVGERTFPFVRLVDRSALAAIRDVPIEPSTHSDRDPAFQQGAAAIRASNLLMLVHPQAVVLTAVDQLTNYPGQWMPAESDLFVKLRPDRLWDEICENLSDPQRFVPIEQWAQTPGDPVTAWNASSRLTANRLDSMGRIAWQLQMPARGHVQVRVYRPNAMRWCGWGAFALSVIVVCALGSRHTQLIIAIAGACGALTQLLPLPWAPLAAGMFWGIVVAVLVRLTYSPWRRSVWVTRPVPGSSAKLISPAMIFIITSVRLSAAQGPVAAADETRGKRISTSPDISEVLIKVDSERRPVDNYVYVEEGFFDRLHRYENQTQPIPSPWLIESAEYRGRLIRDGDTGGYEIPEISASYDLRVLKPGVRVRIPLSRRGLELPVDAAQLDGRSVHVRWESTGQDLSLDVAEPGEYRLELALRPAAVAMGGRQGIELRVPTLVNSRLELLLPPDPPQVRVDGARGIVVTDARRGVLEAELGPNGTLSANWPTNSPGHRREAAAEVEQLMWLQVRPAAVLLDVQFRFTVHSGELRSVTLEVDPRLLLWPTDETPRITAQPDRAGELGRVELVFDEAIDNDRTVRKQFRLTGASGVGNLHLPMLRVSGVETTTRWAGVSIDPSLEFSEVAGPNVTPLALAEFVAAWQGDRPDVQMAFRVPSSDIRWNVSTQLRTPRTASSQLTSIYVGADTTQVDQVADLTTSGGQLFQHRLAVPSNLSVEDISIVALDPGNTVEHVARWFRDESDEVQVFLSEPVSGSYRLRLRGHAPTSTSTPMALPWGRVVDTDTQSTRLRIYRRPDVRVDLVSLDGLDVVESGAFLPDASQNDEQGMSRLVATLEATSGQAPEATIRVMANEPRTQATVTTRLYRHEGGWRTELKGQYRVRGGVLDALRFDVPSAWGRQPVRFDPPVAGYRFDRALAGRRHLHVWPRQAVTDDYTLQLTALANTAEGQRIDVPSIRPLGVDEMTQLVELPSEDDGQPIAWDTKGLQLDSARTDSSNVRTDPFQTYQVLEPAFQVQLKTVKASRYNPSVSLADIRLRICSDDAYYGVSLFDVDPAGMIQVALSVPDGVQLIQVSVGGIPAPLRQIHDRLWQFGLTSQTLPQRISVLFSGSLPADRSNRATELLVPEIDAVSVESTLWTIHRDGHGTASVVPQSASPITAVDQAVTRYQSLAKLTARAAESFAENTPAEIARWYTAWSSAIKTVRADLTRLSSRSIRQDDVIEEIARMDNTHQTLADRLKTNTIRDDAAPKARIADGFPDVFDAMPLVGADVDRYWIHGKLSVTTRAESARSSATEMVPRIAVACCVLLLAVALLAIIQQPTLFTRAMEWMPAFSVVLGIFWWLFLDPSLFGWIIVVYSLYWGLGCIPRLTWLSGRKQSARATDTFVRPQN